MTDVFAIVYLNFLSESIQNLPYISLPCHDSHVTDTRARRVINVTTGVTTDDWRDGDVAERRIENVNV